MEGTTDIGYYFAKGQTGASHRDDRAKQWGQSPLRYADRVSTPTLFLHGELDFRCYKTEALAMFTALKLRGVDTRLCLFEGENHELSRSAARASGSSGSRRYSPGITGIKGYGGLNMERIKAADLYEYRFLSEVTVLSRRGAHGLRRQERQGRRPGLRRLHMAPRQ